MKFTARIITGRGRGKRIGTPTINLALEDVPEDLEEGIYACWVTSTKYEIRNTRFKSKAVMHYGPRPVFKDSASCEIHLLDEPIDLSDGTLEIEVIERMRDVQNFPSPEELIAQIKADIALSREILMKKEADREKWRMDS